MVRMQASTVALRLFHVRHDLNQALHAFAASALSGSDTKQGAIEESTATDQWMEEQHPAYTSNWEVG